MPAYPGQIIGEYRVLDFLDSGGMGEVYRAEHVRLGRAAVVKMLRNLDPGGQAMERFLNEARIQAELNHPNIAVLYEYCESGGCPCIIMEYVDGESLAALIGRQGRLDPDFALSVFAKVVETVGYIHDRGIIHRDIKPQNIKITSQGEVKLLDFGISKGRDSRNLTQTGGIIGTEQHLAPEQWEGKPASVASDIWALGTLLYEMVTGRRTFEAHSTGELYRRIMEAEYTSPDIFAPRLPRRIARIIEGCLRKNPAQRYASATHLLNELRSVNPNATGVGGLFHRLGGLVSWPFSSGKRAAGLAVLGLLAAAGMFVSGGGGGGQTEVRPPEPVTTRQGSQPQAAVMPQPAKSAVAPSPVQAGAPPQPDRSAAMRTVYINVTGEPAELYIGSREAMSGPNKTPFEGRYPLGSHLHVKLKRPKYQDCNGEIDVQGSGERIYLTYRMCKEGEPCTRSECK